LLDCQACRKVLQLEAQPWRAALKDVLQAIPTNP
jgi:dTDP-4-dehydrorhamnose reductase